MQSSPLRRPLFRKAPPRSARRGASRAGESLAAYLDQIGAMAVAGPLEQLEQGKRLAETRRRLQEAILRKPKPSSEEIARYAEAFEAARRDLVRSHLRLVLLLVRPYANRGLPLSDLVQEANLGLMRAADLFDPRRGCRFSTYARWWIRQHLLNALASQAGPLKLPVRTLLHLTRLRRAGCALSHRFGRPATVEEMAQESRIPLLEARRAFRLIRRPLSLDGGADSGSPLAEFLAGPSAAEGVWSDGQEKLEVRVQGAVGSLNDRERRVLELRFGLRGGSARSRRESSLVLGLTQERIRQIELAALQRLRDPGRWGVPIDSLL
jgi:RNA polymerase sigma factor (sigma-70 family)